MKEGLTQIGHSDDFSINLDFLCLFLFYLSEKLVLIFPYKTSKL